MANIPLERGKKSLIDAADRIFIRFMWNLLILDYTKFMVKKKFASHHLLKQNNENLPAGNFLPHYKLSTR